MFWDVEFETYEKENIKRIEPENVVFMSIAESGAMGSPGGVIFAVYAENQVKWFDFNYLYGDNIEEIWSLMPALSNMKVVGIGKVEGLDESWKYVDLGAGNHLFVRGDVYQKFISEVKRRKLTGRGKLYRPWPNIVEDILNKEE